ncbi:hypothetical protein [Roseovarius aquimarinus]|uniref:Uncharacterized protein n=1 Tax=Roseovarius aquimarinus TaxID=1229156 RepID=A0ABW7I758_9RHOB
MRKISALERNNFARAVRIGVGRLGAASGKAAGRLLDPTGRAQ